MIPASASQEKRALIAPNISQKVHLSSQVCMNQDVITQNSPQAHITQTQIKKKVFSHNSFSSRVFSISCFFIID